MKQHNGFTLIELLAVIAVIGILAAIIFPTLTGMRSRAQVAKSTAHIKQIYAANLSYLNDHGEFPSGTDWEPDGTKTWHERIGSYLGMGSDVESVLAHFRAGERPPGVFAVPGRERLLEVDGGQGGGFRSGYIRTGSVNLNNGEVESGGSKKNFLSYQSLSKTYFLIDAAGESAATDFNGWQINPDTVAGWPAHGGPDGHVVVCYMDGHAEILHKSEIPTQWNDVFWRPR